MRELVAVTKISRRRKTESEQDYLNRILLAASQLPKDVLASLSAEAIEWCHTAIERVNHGEPLPTLTASRPPQVPQSEEHQDSNSDSPEVDHKLVGQEIAAQAVTEPRPTSLPDKLSASDHTRRIILENLDKLDKNGIRELVVISGIRIASSSFETIYYDTHKTIQIARGLGLLK
jgi:hypothetical protein